MNQREFGPWTEQFVAEITYETGTTKFGYGETVEDAVTGAMTQIFGEIDKIVIFSKTDKTKVRRVSGSTMTFNVYDEFVVN